MLTGLMDLYTKLDPATTALFGKFVVAALMSGDPNSFVKSKLEAALAPAAPPPPPPPPPARPTVETRGETVGPSRVKRRM